MKKYEVTVTGVGELVKEFLGQKIIVLFNENAPLELQEISVLHTEGELLDDIKAGDRLSFGERVYTITAVGEVANKNMRRMGHTCLKFDGKTSPELPGDIHLSGEYPPEVNLGEKIIIEG
ncbi:MAG: PTS glucitol/sorbitol transporter subunit IIA [Tepidanaerobacteraceae bacterium]|jgi:PTS system glucitol/sorbitol-specific IIA component|nr:PTS glucitol/sorbitol transporter subunit IIA [Tepidanaerobacteraceae bacterium]